MELFLAHEGLPKQSDGWRGLQIELGLSPTSALCNLDVVGQVIQSLRASVS
jgi:hypothetical protein